MGKISININDSDVGVKLSETEVKLLTERTILELIENNPKQADGFNRAGSSLAGFFIGQVMKATNGAADPGYANRYLRMMLSIKKDHPEVAPPLTPNYIKNLKKVVENLTVKDVFPEPQPITDKCTFRRSDGTWKDTATIMPRLSKAFTITDYAYIHDCEKDHISKLIKKGIENNDENFIDQVITNSLRAIHWAKTYKKSGGNLIGESSISDVYYLLRNKEDPSSIGALCLEIRSCGNIDMANTFNNEFGDKEFDISEDMLAAWKGGDFRKVFDLEPNLNPEPLGTQEIGSQANLWAEQFKCISKDKIEARARQINNMRKEDLDNDVSVDFKAFELADVPGESGRSIYKTDTVIGFDKVKPFLDYLAPAVQEGGGYSPDAIDKFAQNEFIIRGRVTGARGSLTEKMRHVTICDKDGVHKVDAFFSRDVEKENYNWMKSLFEIGEWVCLAGRPRVSGDRLIFNIKRAFSARDPDVSIQEEKVARFNERFEKNLGKEARDKLKEESSKRLTLSKLDGSVKNVVTSHLKKDEIPVSVVDDAIAKLDEIVKREEWNDDLRFKESQSIIVKSCRKSIEEENARILEIIKIDESELNSENLTLYRLQSDEDGKRVRYDKWRERADKKSVTPAMSNHLKSLIKDGALDPFSELHGLEWAESHRQYRKSLRYENMNKKSQAVSGVTDKSSSNGNVFDFNIEEVRKAMNYFNKYISAVTKESDISRRGNSVIRNGQKVKSATASRRGNSVIRNGQKVKSATAHVDKEIHMSESASKITDGLVGEHALGEFRVKTGENYHNSAVMSKNVNVTALNKKSITPEENGDLTITSSSNENTNEPKLTFTNTSNVDNWFPEGDSREVRDAILRKVDGVNSNVAVEEEATAKAYVKLLAARRVFQEKKNALNLSYSKLKIDHLGNSLE